MSEKQTLYSPVDPLTRIITLRGQKVILDSNLAAIYGVETFRFNEAVKRNRNRFPDDFAFQLTRQEFTNLISQPAISSSGHGGVRAFVKMREQILNRAEWERRLTDIEETLMEHDAALRDLYQKIRPLLLAPSSAPRKRIGFSVSEKRTRYRTQSKS